MSNKEKCMNKKLHPYWKTGIYGWLGEEVDDNDYMLCPICGEILTMNYWDYSAEHDGDNKCPECGQELDYSEIYDFEDTLYFRQLLEMKEDKLTDLEAKLEESEAKVASREDEIKFKEADVNQLKWILEGKKKDIDQLRQQLEESESESNARYTAWQEEIGECDRLREQLAEKDAEVQSWKDGTMVVKLGKLEEQIAEKHQAIESLQEINKSLGQTCNNDAKEIERLREQLKLAKMGESFEQEKKNNALKSQNQTAIAELEKVEKLLKHKGFVLKVKPPITMPTTPMNEYLKEFMILEDDFDRIFDQQIKSLKGDKVE